MMLGEPSVSKKRTQLDRVIEAARAYGSRRVAGEKLRHALETGT
jgi:hypothetical protein